MTLADRLKPLTAWARRVKRDGVTLWFAMRHPGVPWHAKALGLVVVAYALSPIDLIPDFIPILGYLDDVILLPVLIWLAIALIPKPALAHCREQADRWMADEGRKPRSFVGGVVVLIVWLALALAAGQWILHKVQAG
jgi:uncharacterized membrane protein YkvA (DUF1232 family)